MTYTSNQKYMAEFIGTFFLLATVVGSGIMGEALAGGNTAIALLGNTIPTGAILVLLITMLGPISGAHFNPAVTMIFALKKQITISDSAVYILAQIAGGILGVYAAHAMFDLPILQWSAKLRTGEAQWISEIIATFGLVFVILATLKSKAEAVAMNVGLYITAAYWFTASTSFANPAVTIARGLSNTFAGIRIDHAPAFIIAQIIGALLALIVCNWLLTTAPQSQKSASNKSQPA